MSEKTISYLVMAIFAVIALYFLITVVMDISNTTSDCESIEFAANETLTAAANTMLLYPTPALYQDDECTTVVGNFTYASGGYTLGFNESADTYYGTYDYDTPVTVFSINFAFMAILVAFGIGIAIVSKLSWKN